MRARRPNVVLVVLDAVRRDHLSCYGHGRPTTPNIDRLAAEGTRYTRAWAASCWTIPAHASLFTGTYPSTHGADMGMRSLPADIPTLAEVLAGRGYRTASFSANGFITGHTGLARGFRRSVDVEGLRGNPDTAAGRVIRALHRRWRAWTARDRGTRRATRGALEWIDSGDRRDPFFLFLNYMDCHLPYGLKGEERYAFVPDGRREAADAALQDPFAVMAGRATLTGEDVALLEALYDGCLRYMDRHLGRIVDRLEARGALEDTVLVVTSDHGESFGEHGLFDHQYGLYEPLLSVPLVIRWPAGAGEREGGRGTVDARLAQHVDLFPTLAALAGAEHGGAGSGSPAPAYSLLEPPRREASFAEYLRPNLRAIRRRFPDADVSPFDRALRAVRTETHKLIVSSDGRTELYDLRADPGEERDLSEVETEGVESLERRIRSVLGGWPPETRPSAEGVDDEGDTELLRERLEALGYL